MADEDQPHAAFGNQSVENAEHFKLNRHVEGRSWFVGDQHFRLGDQHHGDHDALAHTARNFVRIKAHDAFSIANLHGFEHGD